MVRMALLRILIGNRVNTVPLLRLELVWRRVLSRLTIVWRMLNRMPLVRCARRKNLGRTHGLTVRVTLKVRMLLLLLSRIPWLRCSNECRALADSELDVDAFGTTRTCCHAILALGRVLRRRRVIAFRRMDMLILTMMLRLLLTLMLLPGLMV
jgi:hypothetical protein